MTHALMPPTNHICINTKNKKVLQQSVPLVFRIIVSSYISITANAQHLAISDIKYKRFKLHA